MSAKSSDERTLNICINFRAGNMLPSCGAVGSRELADALTRQVQKRRNKDVALLAALLAHPEFQRC